MGTINHNTKLVTGEMQLLVQKVFVQTNRGLLLRAEFPGLAENMKNFEISQKTVQMCF